MLITKINLSRSVIKHVVVLGGGAMGAGIAQVTAQSGRDVTLVDVNEENLQKAKEMIEKSAARVAREKFTDRKAEMENFVSGVADKLRLSTNLKESVSEADLVIEAVSENLKLKLSLFSEMDKIAPDRAIFASNTSSLSIADLASATGRRDRFAGLHFFNPVPVMKLLEVVRIPDTSDETLRELLKFGESLGKETITCKDTPGFIVNRLLITILVEGVRMMERGDATRGDIDAAMKLGARLPMGPMELCDYVGVDIVKSVLDIWHERFPDDPLFEPSPTLNRLTAEGKLGIKTGEGFYSYKK